MAINVEQIHFYKVHDIPEQVRVKMDLNATVSTCTDMNDAIAQLGVGATENADFNAMLNSVATFSEAFDGYEIPTINLSDDNNINATFNAATSSFYMFVAIINLGSASETSTIVKKHVVTGYTSEVEASFDGRLPAETKLYVNDTYTLRYKLARNAYGQMAIVPSSCAILSDTVTANAFSGNGFDFDGGANESYVLPHTMMEVSQLIQDNLPTEGLSDGETITFSSTVFRVPQEVSGAIISPEAFALTATESQLNGLKESEEMSGPMASWNQSTSVSAGSFMRDRKLTVPSSATPVIRAVRDTLMSLGDVVGGNTVGNEGAMTYQQLYNVTSNKDALAEYAMRTVSAAMLQTEPELGADRWAARSPAGILAYDIASRLGHVMIRHLTGKLNFHFSTMDYYNGELGQAIIQPGGAAGIDESGSIPLTLAQSLPMALKEKVIRQATRDFAIPARVHVQAQLGSAIRVEVTMEDGCGTEAFTYASFMSGRLNLTTTNDQGYVYRLGDKMRSLTNAISEGFDEFNSRATRSNIASDDFTFSGEDNSGGNPFGTNGGGNNNPFGGLKF